MWNLKKIKNTRLTDTKERLVVAKDGVGE